MADRNARRPPRRHKPVLTPSALILALAGIFQQAAGQLPVSEQTQQTDNQLQDVSNRISLHADIPFLAQSHHRIWYIWLVIAMIGAATCCSTGVVIAGLVKWRRRRRQLKLLREEGKLPKGGIEAGKLHGLTEADLKGPPLKIFKPSKIDVERLDKLYRGPQQELWAEKCRRTAKHEKPLHTLQALHRMKSF